MRLSLPCLTLLALASGSLLASVPARALDIAARHHSGVRYFEPMLHVLAGCGILQGRRGKKGGYRLAREAGLISVADVIRALARDGARDVVVVPVGFVCDHVEVLYDLDVEAKAVAESSGIGFHRAAAANDHPAFVAMLADLVRRGP